MAKIKFSLCNEMFQGWPVEEVFGYASQVGYHGVEIAPHTLAESVTDISENRREQIRWAAEKEGVEIVGLHWLLLSPEGLYLNHPNPQIRKRTQDYLIELVRFCGDLGGKIMVVGSPRQRNILEGHTYQEAWQLTVEVLQGCLDVAEERGVILCIEPIDKAVTNFINTAAEGVRLVEEIGHPNLKLMVDVRATINQGEDVVAVIRKYKDLIVHVHANDASGRGPGFGSTDFLPIVKALRDVSYDGYLSVEVFDFKPDPRTIAQRGIKYLKNCLKGQCPLR